jgi:uncharacterized membrane protein YqjE
MGEEQGLFHSLKRLLASLIGIARTRAELLSLEVEEEIDRLAKLALCAILSLFFMGVAVVLIAILIVVAFWENDKLLALSLLALFFSIIGLYSGALFLKKAKSRSRLFSQSIAEFSKDLSELE